jgi:putative signal transducing protein
MALAGLDWTDMVRGAESAPCVAPDAGAESTVPVACKLRGLVLTDDTRLGAPDPDLSLVSVIRTDEVGLIPLVRMALEQAGIEYVQRDVPSAPELAGGRAMRGNPPLMLEEILVAADDEGRAREIIAALGTAPATAPPHPSTPPQEGRLMEGATIELVDTETSRPVGRITSAQLAWLVGQLEEESTEDRDYYIDGPTLDMLQDAGGDQALILMLRTALGARDGMEVRYTKT